LARKAFGDDRLRFRSRVGVRPARTASRRYPGHYVMAGMMLGVAGVQIEPAFGLDGTTSAAGPHAENCPRR
jgi:hypothetical protein